MPADRDQKLDHRKRLQQLDPTRAWDPVLTPFRRALRLQHVSRFLPASLLASSNAPDNSCSSSSQSSTGDQEVVTISVGIFCIDH